MDADGRAVLRACGAGGLTDPAGRLPDPLAADSRRTPPGPDRGTPRDPGMKPAPMSLKKIWLLLALLAVVVHGAWIQTVRVCMPEYGASPYKYPYNMGDSGSYTLSSQALFDSRPMAPLFRERIVFPLFLAAGIKLGDPTKTLFLMLPLHGVAVMAICYVAGTLSRRRWVSVLSGLLYVANPSLYNFGINLGPDVLHAQLAIIATALAIAWPRSLRMSLLVGATLAWIVTQLTRPTYYPIALGLALLWWPCLKNPGVRRATILALAATLLVPMFFVGTNAIRYGVATPYFAGYENVVKIIPARIRMLKRHAQDPSQLYSRLYLEEEERAGQDPDYLALQLRVACPTPKDFSLHYRNLMKASLDLIGSNFGLFIRSGIEELRLTTMGCGSSPANKIIPANAAFAAAHDSVIRKTTKLALPLFVLGVLMALANRQRRVLAFVFICFALVFAPSVMLWWQGLRTRLPAELLMIPFVALSLGSLPGLGFIAGTALAGYVPFKAFRFPEIYLKWTAWLCFALAALAVILPRMRGPRRPDGEI